MQDCKVLIYSQGPNHFYLCTLTLQSLEAFYCREKASLRGVEDHNKCLPYSCKLLLNRVLAVSLAFVSRIVYKNTLQFGNTSGEEELLLGEVEAWCCMILNCAV